ncbi:heme-binding protein A precursor [Roseovarius sp. A-2]|uniref:ABC transporter substrate-binding protein n=1 Tax=Roseovarius sp. A-2 TaxID=1570360 RepID=UPI0009B5666E|nr:ABC transporter substrate-binding protein [Roseovarius sp. A-2]GAW33477.1 heme-binding protein A precursor [Roseovarius sp. A-2]
MTQTPPHPATAPLVTELRAGRMGRREFLSRVTTLGLGATAAYALGGLTRPVRAQPAIARGGTLRIQQSVKPPKDPRSYDWSELANQTRGFLEYLVEYKGDGVFHGMLLDSWEVNADATGYVLRLRPGVRWNNGDPFTAQDVAYNITRWCDTTAPGNSMASRCTALIDPATGQARAGAIRVEDELTVSLTLSRPDIALIANMSDYPAAIVHQSYDGGDPFTHGIGTGPFRPVGMTVGERCILERHPDHDWWGTKVFGGPWLDRVEFIDLGTNPSTWLAAADDGFVDLLYETVGDFIDAMNAIGWTATHTETAATMVVRASQSADLVGTNPYRNAAVRRALALAVDNAICLELGYGGRGTVAANHHVSPIHPAYADIGPAPYDPALARSEIEAEGLLGFQHELVTLDDEWQRNTGDAVAAQLRDAGLRVARRIVPGATFWSNWRDYPFSGTQWNHRPLDVQVLSLAYRSGAVWNESGFSNAEFDALLDEANRLADPEARRAVMARLETILRDEGVIIQPFWRALYNHHNGQLVNAEKHPSNEIHLYRIGFRG